MYRNSHKEVETNAQGPNPTKVFVPSDWTTSFPQLGSTRTSSRLHDPVTSQQRDDVTARVT